MATMKDYKMIKSEGRILFIKKSRPIKDDNMRFTKNGVISIAIIPDIDFKTMKQVGNTYSVKGTHTNYHRYNTKAKAMEKVRQIMRMVK